MIADFQGYTEKDIPISTIEIKIGSHFSYADLPKLVRQIQNLHNNFINTLSEDDLEKSRLRETTDYILQTAEVMAANYYFWVNKIEELNEGKNIPAFTNYATKLRDIAKDFDTNFVEQNKKEDISFENYIKKLEEIVKNFAPQDFVFSKIREWLKNVKELEAQAQGIIDKPRKKIEKTLPQRINGDEKEQTKLINVLDRLIAKSVRKSLTESFEQIVFERGEKEVWRQSDVPEIFADNFRRQNWPFIFRYLARFFPKEWRSLDNLKYSLQMAKESGDAEKIVTLQTKIVKVLLEILYSEKFFFYKKGQSNLDGISKKKLVNCMARSQILHLLCQKIMGIETLGVTTNGHFFSCLSLANGKMLSLDGRVEEIDLENKAGLKEIKRKFYSVGTHEKMYCSSIWSWQGSFYCQENKYKESIFCYQKAIALNPNNSDYYFNLGTALQKDGDLKGAIASYQKAIALNPNNPGCYSNLGTAFSADGDIKGAIASYKKDIGLSPNNPNYYFNLGVALQDDRDIENAEKSYLTAAKLSHYKDAWILTGLADFYYDINNELEALKYYKLALDAMNAGSPSFRDKKWIQDKILELENFIKK